jgi:hypothetical protein
MFRPLHKRLAPRVLGPRVALGIKLQEAGHSSCLLSTALALAPLNGTCTLQTTRRSGQPCVLAKPLAYLALPASEPLQAGLPQCCKHSRRDLLGTPRRLLQ